MCRKQIRCRPKGRRLNITGRPDKMSGLLFCRTPPGEAEGAFMQLWSGCGARPGRPEGAAVIARWTLPVV